MGPYGAFGGDAYNTAQGCGISATVTRQLVTAGLTYPNPLNVCGSVTIQDKWHAGPLNYLGLTIAGFPNLFNIAGPGSTSAFTNVVVAIEQHVEWIADCIAHLDANGVTTIEASEAAEAAWAEHVNAAARRTVFLTCNSWYLGANISGKPRMFMPLAGGFPAYAERCAEVARKGYEGFVLA